MKYAGIIRVAIIIIDTFLSRSGIGYAGLVQSVQRPGVNNRGSVPGKRYEFLLFASASRPALGPTEPPHPVDTGGSFPAGKAERETDHLPSYIAEINAWNYTSTPSVRLNGVVFK
jgi:hypothetical protein